MCRCGGDLFFIRASSSASPRAISPVLRAQSGLEIQAGTFLTRDRGWNYELNLLGRLGVAAEWSARWRGVGHITGRMSACPCGEMGIDLRPIQASIENGLGIGYDLQGRLFDRRLTGLIGVEWFQALGEEQVSGGTLVASAGAGWSWGRRRSWGSELRYGAFGRRISATSGRLEWTVVRRW
jgi:hypothetical protein